MRRNEVLFNSSARHDFQQSQLRSLGQSIGNLDEDTLLKTPANDLRDYFVEQYHIDVPVLREDQIVADQRETEIDASNDPLRGGRFSNHPIHVTGTEGVRAT